MDFLGSLCFRLRCSGLSLSRVMHVALELGMKELLARNAGINSACRRCETGKALDKGSEHPTGPEEL